MQGNLCSPGAGLAHAARLAQPAVLISGDDLAEHLRTVLGPLNEWELLEAKDDGKAPRLDRALGASPIDNFAEAHFADDAGMLYTSGTTGKSKAVVLSHRHFTSQAAIAVRDFGLRHDDVL